MIFPCGGHDGWTLRLVELAPSEPDPRTRYRIGCGPFAFEVDDVFDDGVLGRILAVMAGR